MPKKKIIKTTEKKKKMLVTAYIDVEIGEKLFQQAEKESRTPTNMASLIISKYYDGGSNGEAQPEN
jgi:hypothetical protein